MQEVNLCMVSVMNNSAVNIDMNGYDWLAETKETKALNFLHICREQSPLSFPWSRWYLNPG